MLKKFILVAALVGISTSIGAQTPAATAPETTTETATETKPEPEESKEPEPEPERAKPFSFEAAYTGDFYGNAFGGLDTGVGFMGKADLGVGFDTEAARWWRGGSFFVSGTSIHGKSLSAHYLGDLQVASNIDGGSHTYLYNLWFSQRFAFRRTGAGLSFTLGLQDLNAEFMVSENAGEYINSSFGVHSVIALGTPVPIFPLTGLGAAVRWDIDERFAWQVAVFDGDQTPFEDGNPVNMNWRLCREDGMLAMSELSAAIDIDDKEGTYKVGGYYHSGTENWGLYMTADQTVFENDARRVSLLAQAAFAPKSLNDNHYYIGLGANLSGVFSKQQRDMLGLAVAHAGLHDATHRHETTIELFYKYRFGRHITLQPDLQYIVNPAGTDDRLRNALACILRLRLDF